MERLNGRVVQSDMVRGITQLPPQGNLLFPQTGTLEADLLLDDLGNQRFQATREKLYGRPLRRVVRK
jgi:hypothetical protein